MIRSDNAKCHFASIIAQSLRLSQTRKVAAHFFMSSSSPSGKKKKSFGLNLRTMVSSASSALTSPRKKKSQQDEGFPSRYCPPVRPTVQMDLSILKKDKLPGIVKFQGLARGYLVRKAIRQSGSIQQQKVQLKSIRLLVRAEEKYLGLLKILITEYFNPCKEMCKGNKKKLKKIDGLFINVEGLYKYHLTFCALLRSYLDNWPSLQNIGHEILVRLTDFTFYQKYVNEIPFSKTLYREMKKDKSSIIAFIVSVNERRQIEWDSPGHKFRDFRLLLKLPLKQLGEYKSPLKKLMISTPPNHPDYKYRVGIAATFRELGLYFKKKFLDSVAMQDMAIVDGRLITKNKFPFLIPGRKIRRKGEMYVNQKSARLVILCNDICLITEVMNSVCYSYEHHFDLKGAKILRLSTSPDGNKHVFSINAADGRSFTFTPATYGKSKSWQKSFEDALSKRNDLVFGLSVSEVVQRDEAPLPRIVFSIAYRLNCGLTEDKVFRAAGDSKALRGLKRRFNHHLKDLDLTSSYSQDVAALFIPYLESLPDSIFLLDTNCKLLSDMKSPSDEEIFQFFSKQVGLLSVANRNFFEFLLLLLHRAATASSDADSLTTIELAVLFSPLLFKSTDWNLRYCYKIPRIAKSFKTAIENPQKLFPIDPNGSLPDNIDDFLFADFFGAWWRRFRMEEENFMIFLAQDANITALITNLVIQTDDRTSPESYKQSHAAALSCLALTSDSMKAKLFENTSHMAHLFDLVSENAKREHTLRFFRDTFEALVESCPQEMTEYLENTPDSLSILMDHISSGNVFAIFSNVASKSLRYQYSKHHSLLYLWCSSAFRMVEMEELSETTLESISAFFGIVFGDKAFLVSHAQHLEQQIYSSNLISIAYKKALDKSCPASLCIQLLGFLQQFIVKKVQLIEEENEENDNEEGDGEESQTESESDAETEEQSADDEIVISYPFPSLVPSIAKEMGTHIDSFFSILFEPLQQEKKNVFGLGTKRQTFLSFLACMLKTDEMEGNSLGKECILLLWNLFFFFPSNNIAQNLIVDILCYVATSPQSSLLLDAKIPELLVNEISSERFACSCSTGQLYSLAIYFKESSLLSALQKEKEWKCVEKMVADYQVTTTADAVKRRVHMFVTDRYEDRI